ncbi:MAG: 50S ribosomal protein L4, partial [Candidatus Omnitrophota bacterium]
MTLTLDVYTIDGKKTGDIELDSTLFDGKVNESILWEVVKMYEANVRQGTVSTKTRGEVRGGGRKP